MIVRENKAPVEWMDGGRIEKFQYSDAGGLAQFGAYGEILQPEAESSHRHYHEEEDEFLYAISGEATVIEDDGEHTLHPGDAACWPACDTNAHHVVNRSDEPCTYLIFGTRMSRDTVHYPDSGRVLYDDEDGTWRLHLASDGTLLNEGKNEQFRPMTWR